MWVHVNWLQAASGISLSGLHSIVSGSTPTTETSTTCRGFSWSDEEVKAITLWVQEELDRAVRDKAVCLHQLQRR